MIEGDSRETREKQKKGHYGARRTTRAAVYQLHQSVRRLPPSETRLFWGLAAVPIPHSPRVLSAVTCLWISFF